MMKEEHQCENFDSLQAKQGVSCFRNFEEESQLGNLNLNTRNSFVGVSQYQMELDQLIDSYQDLKSSNLSNVLLWKEFYQ